MVTLFPHRALTHSSEGKLTHETVCIGQTQIFPSDSFTKPLQRAEIFILSGSLVVSLGEGLSFFFLEIFLVWRLLVWLLLSKNQINLETPKVFYSSGLEWLWLLGMSRALHGIFYSLFTNNPTRPKPTSQVPQATSQTQHMDHIFLHLISSPPQPYMQGRYPRVTELKPKRLPRAVRAVKDCANPQKHCLLA